MQANYIYVRGHGQAFISKPFKSELKIHIIQSDFSQKSSTMSFDYVFTWRYIID